MRKLLKTVFLLAMVTGGLQAGPMALSGLALTAYVGTTTGDWNTTTNWTPNGTPGNGDTVTINNGITITIPVGYNAIIGDSLGIIPALACTSTTGTGSLAIAAGQSLTFRGNMQWCKGNYTFAAGSSLIHDSSLAISPSTTHYVIDWAPAFNASNGTVTMSGTSGAHVTVSAAPGSGYFGGFSVTSTRSPNLTWSYVDITSYPPSSVTTPVMTIEYNTSTTNLALDHVVIGSRASPSGRILINNFCATCTWQWDNVFYFGQNSATGRGLEFGGNSAFSSGERHFYNSVIEGGLAPIFMFTTGSISGFKINNNFLGGFSQSGSNQCSEYKYNFVFRSVPGAGTPTNTCTGNTMLKNYYWRLAHSANPHLLDWAGSPPAGATTFDKWILDIHTSTNDSTGDAIQESATPSATHAMTVRNTIFLPNPFGASAGAFINISGSGGNDTDFSVTATNNTYTTTDTGSNAILGNEATGGPGHAGLFPLIDGNLGWRPTAGTGFGVGWQTSVTPTAALYTEANYNWTHNVTLPWYRLPANAAYAVTPGANDGAGDPRFADVTRRVIFADQYLFGAAIAPEWSSQASGYTFSIGEVASHACTGQYGGAKINWRAIATSTNVTANSEPGCGSANLTYWEPSIVQTIRDQTLLGTRFTDGATGTVAGSITEYIVDSVRKGNTPQSTAGVCTFYSGAQAGAVPCDKPAILPMMP